MCKLQEQEHDADHWEGSEAGWALVQGAGAVEGCHSAEEGFGDWPGGQQGADGPQECPQD